MPVPLTRTDYRLDKLVTVSTIGLPPQFHVDSVDAQGVHDRSLNAFAVGNDMTPGDNWIVAVVYRDSQAEHLTRAYWEAGTIFDIQVPASIDPAQPVYRGIRVKQFGPFAADSRFAGTTQPILAADGSRLEGYRRNLFVSTFYARVELDPATIGGLPLAGIAAYGDLGFASFDPTATALASLGFTRNVFVQIVNDVSSATDDEGGALLDRQVTFVTRQQLAVGEVMELDHVALGITSSEPIARTGFWECVANGVYDIPTPARTGPV